MPCKQRYATREEFIKVCLEKGKDYVPSGTKRAVLCIETGVVYESAHEAARALGIMRESVKDSCLRSAANVTSRYYSCRGKCVYHFRYCEMPREDDGQTWKPVELVGGMFEVSDMGQVRRASTGRILKSYVSKSTGQVCVMFTAGTLFHAFSVSQLVAEAFMPDHGSGALAMHIDGDQTNNSLSNLCWGTMKDIMNTPSMKAKISLANRTSDRVRAYRASEKAAAIRQAFKEYGKSIRKKVICEETGVVYDSASDAARSNGLSRCAVVCSCKLTGSRFSIAKQAGKPVLHFRWYNPDDPKSHEARHFATDQDYKDKVAWMRRRVLCIETGVIYESLTAAEAGTGVCTSNISRACKNRDPKITQYARNGKVCYHFRYADEQ